MFEIEYKGGNSVVISTKKATAVIDPRASLVGLKDLSTKDAIVIATEPRFALNDPQARISIEGPGEYEVSDFSIRGVRATRHIDTEADEPISTLYRVEIGELRVGIIGNVADKLSEDQLEGLGVLDILILPVGGGGYTLDATAASTIVRQIDPKVVIPVHYAEDGVTYEVPQDTVETFTKELGAPVEQAGAKYKVKGSSGLPVVLTTVELARS